MQSFKFRPVICDIALNMGSNLQILKKGKCGRTCLSLNIANVVNFSFIYKFPIEHSSLSAKVSNTLPKVEITDYGKVQYKWQLLQM